MKKIAIVIGARPQFIKHAALEIALRDDFNVVTIHTGQHYDQNMSDVFFKELNIAQPTHMLNIGSGDHGDQTGKMMIKIEEIVKYERPDVLLVYGDTNSTLAGALVAAKLNIPVAHVEAGLRSFNKAMPEEINRILTDHVSSVLFCPTNTAVANLKREGIDTNVFNEGDVMVDMIRIAREKNILTQSRDYGKYYFSTIHRPYNTDDLDRLMDMIRVFNVLDKPVKFAVHPRTLHKLTQAGVNTARFQNIHFLEPVSYFESLQLQYNAQAVITDSGGIQKEAYVLKKKCVTIRSETEWLETVNSGWNDLVFDNLELLKTKVGNIPQVYEQSLFGDGYASNKISLTLKIS